MWGGATLFLNPTHHFQISMGLGSGTNNYIELMALKLLLCFAIERNCKKLQVFADSLIVINWIKKIKKCRNTSLAALFEEVSRLLTNFESLTLKHVYRERNMDADILSKAEINLAWGTWKFIETKEATTNEFYHRPFMDLPPGQGRL